MDGNGGMDGLLGVAGIIIDSSCGSFPKIPYVKRTSKCVNVSIQHHSTNPKKTPICFFPSDLPIFGPNRYVPRASLRRYAAPVDEAAIAAASQRGPRQGVGVAAGDGAEEGIDLAVVNGFKGWFFWMVNHIMVDSG